MAKVKANVPLSALSIIETRTHGTCIVSAERKQNPILRTKTRKQITSQPRKEIISKMRISEGLFPDSHESRFSGKREQSRKISPNLSDKVSSPPKHGKWRSKPFHKKRQENDVGKPAISDEKDN